METGAKTDSSTVVGAIVLVLSASSVLQRVSAMIMPSLVEGLQISTGILLVIRAVDMMRGLAWYGPTFKWHNNMEMAVACAIFSVLTFADEILSKRLAARVNKIPVALVLICLGFSIALDSALRDTSPLRLGPGRIEVGAPEPRQVASGFLKAGLGQLPLTLLNSVVAVCALATSLAPETASRRVIPWRVGISIGVMNILGAFFGCMPYCPRGRWTCRSMEIWRANRVERHFPRYR